MSGKVIGSMFSRLSYVYPTYILRISYVFDRIQSAACFYRESRCKSTAFFRNKQEKYKKKQKNLHNSKKSSNFAADLQITSQQLFKVYFIYDQRTRR